MPSFYRPDAVVELLDAQGENMNTTLTPIASAAGRAFQIEATQSPAFARVKGAGTDDKQFCMYELVAAKRPRHLRRWRGGPLT